MGECYDGSKGQPVILKTFSSNLKKNRLQILDIKIHATKYSRISII